MIDKFAQSLNDFSSPHRKHSQYFTRDEQELSVLKTAATTMMNNRTPEGVNKYIVDRIVSDFGVKKIQVKPNISIKKTDEENKIVNAEGSVDVVLTDKLAVKIPFKIAGGEFSDFTTISLGKNKVPYTTAAINKLKSVKEQEEKKSSPYMGTAKPINANTDPGFLEQAEGIRQNMASRNGNGPIGHVNYVYAGELDNMIEKVASIEPMDFSKLEGLLDVYLTKTYGDILEKKAALEIDGKIDHIASIYSKLDKLPLQSVKGCKNGTRILFPERGGKDGNEISMTAGVVFTDIKYPIEKSGDFFNDSKTPRPSAAPDAIVVAYDGRMAIINGEDDLLALADKNAPTKLPSSRIKAIVGNETCIPIIGDTVYSPIKITKSRNKYFYDKKYSSTYGIETPHDDNEAPNMFAKYLGNANTIKEFEVFDYNNKQYRSSRPSPHQGFLMMFPGGKFDQGDVKDKKIKALFGEDYAAYSEYITCYNYMNRESILLDEDTKVIKISGMIAGYIKDKRELEPANNTMMKFASEKIYVKTVDKARNVYAVSTSGMKGKKYGNNLSKGQVKRIMKGLGYTPDIIGEMEYKLNKNGTYTKELPLNANINDIYNGKVEEKKQSVIKSVIDKSFDKKKVKKGLIELSAQYGGNLIGDIASGCDMMYNALEYLSKLAYDSEGCGRIFEKLAMQYRNDDLLNVAKTCVITNKIANFAKEALEKDDCYNGAKEAFRYVDENCEHLAFIRDNLADLADSQFDNNNEMIPYGAIKVAMENIDQTIDLARCLSKEAGTSSQDAVCEECGAKVDYPLKNGKCQECQDEELESLNDDSKSKKTDDTYEGDGNKPKKGDKDTDNPW